MGKKVKHLEFIQNIIERMAKNSFFLKSWSLTFTTVLMGILIKEDEIDFLFISTILVFIFWFLDSYYLKQEKLFRNLYDEVRKKEENKIDFSLKRNGEETICNSFFSLTLLFFYLGIIALMIMTYFLIK